MYRTYTKLLKMKFWSAYYDRWCFFWDTLNLLSTCTYTSYRLPPDTANGHTHERVMECLTTYRIDYYIMVKPPNTTGHFKSQMELLGYIYVSPFTASFQYNCLSLVPRSSVLGVRRYNPLFINNLIL